ncbi:hypothetical protein ACWC5I_00825 [Kitasatospora sp. NPDC001574]
MDNHLAESLAVHAEALAAWRECRTKAQQIENPEERAAALKTLAGKRPVHPYLGGLSLTALRQGNRRMLAPIQSRHADARAQHAETLDAWKKRREAAQQIEDPEKRAAALDALKRERPTHPGLVAAGCAVVSAVVLAGIPAVRQHAGVIISGSLTLWMIAALILGTTTAPEKAEQPPADDAAPDAGEWIQDPPDEAVLWALVRHTAALTKQGTAAHLQAVLDEARTRGEMTDWTVPDLVEELASYGVPVVEQKKLTVNGRNLNRAGVLLSALPETDPAPFPAIVQPAAKSAA